MRKDRVLEFVINSCKDQDPPVGVTAREVADGLDIWRNDASVELNKLVTDGKLEKSGKKNIRYLPADKESKDTGSETPAAAADEIDETADVFATQSESDAFSKLVGYNGSLRYQIQIAKAVTAYPPHGLNILITGPTGSGKSYFAGAIGEYAKETNAFRSKTGDVPFISFNCAEYADNPQLLLSHLFGYKKGAFTDAIEDTEGLVEKVDGGILFLDEIHSLSAYGQEMFFTLLDTGVYYRIGDSTQRHSTFMLIGATTKPVTELLDTFLRRMPVVIQFPKLSDRPVTERLEFIKRFYADEASQIGRPLCVAKNALNAILDYSMYANLGMLKNVVQISCAKAYLRYSSRSSRKKGQTVRVESADLSFRAYTPDYVQENTFPNYNVHFEEDLSVEPESTASAENDVSVFEDIYDFMDENLYDTSKTPQSRSDVKQMVSSAFDQYYRNLDKLLRNPGSDSNLLDSVLFPGSMGIAAQFLDMASYELKHIYPPSSALYLAMHLSQYVNRMRSEQPSFSPDLRDLARDYAYEQQFIRAHIRWLSDTLNVMISEDEACFLAIFLNQMAEKDTSPSICVTVVSWTDTTALIQNVYSECSSIPLHGLQVRSTGSIFSEVSQNLRSFHGCKGTLIFSDIRALTSLEKELSNATDVPCKVIPVVDRQLILDTCRLAAVYTGSLEDIYAAVMSEYGEFIRQIMPPSAADEISRSPVQGNAVRSKVVLSVCVTGVGSARSIQSILENRLSYIPDLTVISCSFLTDAKQLAEQYRDSLKLVVGTIDPGINGVPFITADQVFTADGMLNIASLLESADLPNLISDIEETQMDEESFHSMLMRSFDYIAPNVDSALASKCIDRMVTALENRYYKKAVPHDVYMQIFMHAAGMLERLADGEILNLEDEFETRIQKNADWLSFLVEVIDQAFEPFHYAIPRAEYYYFMLGLPQDLD